MKLYTLTHAGYQVYYAHSSLVLKHSTHAQEPWNEAVHTTFSVL